MQPYRVAMYVVYMLLNFRELHGMGAYIYLINSFCVLASVLVCSLCYQTLLILTVLDPGFLETLGRAFLKGDSTFCSPFYFCMHLEGVIQTPRSALNLSTQPFIKKIWSSFVA